LNVLVIDNILFWRRESHCKKLLSGNMFEQASDQRFASIEYVDGNEYVFHARAWSKEKSHICQIKQG